MPFDYGLRLDNRQRIANARDKPIKAHKNQSVDGAEGLSLRSGSPQNVYLLPQRPNFRLKRRPRPDQIDDHPNNEPDKISHPATASPDSRSTASQIGFATGTGAACPLRGHLVMAVALTDDAALALRSGSGARGAGRLTSTSHHRSGIQSGLFQPFNASRNTRSLDGRNRRVG
jgi:hypothetical protein